MSLNTILATAPLTATNYILKATGTTLGQSLIWDNGTNVGIGNTNTSYTLDVSGTGRFTSDLTSLTIKSTYTGSTNYNSFGNELFIGTNGANNNYFSDNMYYNGGWLLAKAGAGAQIYFGASAAGSIDFRTAPTGAAGGTPTITNRMTILQAGNVGIGTSSPNARLSLGNTTSSAKLLLYDGGFTGSGGNGYFAGFAIDSPSANDTTLLAHYQGALVFGRYTNANDTSAITERMRITSGGVSLFGGTTFTTITSAVLGATNPAFTGRNWSFGPNSSGDYVVYHNQGGGNTGVYLSYGGSSWTSNSDEKIKDIIEVIPNALESIINFRAVKFYWKGDESKKENLGLIAQDVQKSYPQLIDKQIFDDKEILGVRYTELIPVLVKAIQEQHQTIQELSKQNEELSNRLIKLESK